MGAILDLHMWHDFTDGVFSDSDAASPRQTQTDNDASGSPQRVAGRPLGVPYEIAAGDVDVMNSCQIIHGLWPCA